MYYEQAEKTKTHKGIERCGAVKLITVQGYSVAEAAQNLGVNTTKAGRWKKAFPIFLLCKVMHVSRSGYYSWRSSDQSVLQKEPSRLIPKVKAIHRLTRCFYGARRVSEELQVEDEFCGRAKGA